MPDIATKAGWIAALMAIVGIALGQPGCGGGKTPPRLVPVQGEVVVAEGKPITGGGITFHPDAANSFQDDNPSSMIAIDGAYTMKTFPFGEGVAPGKYKVTLAPVIAGSLGKPEYAEVSKTPWEVEVPETGLTGYTFEVK